MNNSVEAYADLMERWMSAFDDTQPYPSVLAEFTVTSRREGWKALVTFHACVIPGARKILDGQAALGASGVFCTIILKGANREISKASGFSVCCDDDDWSNVIGMRVALADALSLYDHDDCEAISFIRHIWKGFVKNVVQEEAKLFG